MKAYTTRVGEGPFPTENKEFSDLLHGMGREFGATTGRARRCGWFDAVATRYAGMINGIDEIAVTNLDGLDSLPRSAFCVAYKHGSKKLEVPPSDSRQLVNCQPIYLELPAGRNPRTPRGNGATSEECAAVSRNRSPNSAARNSHRQRRPNRDQTIVL
jgi:adenylosuccinate synthase